MYELSSKLKKRQIQINDGAMKIFILTIIFLYALFRSTISIIKDSGYKKSLPIDKTLYTEIPVYFLERVHLKE